jgi:hypothetical protein
MPTFAGKSLTAVEVMQMDLEISTTTSPEGLLLMVI